VVTRDPPNMEHVITQNSFYVEAVGLPNQAL
jgi:hypothetical protein